MPNQCTTCKERPQRNRLLLPSLFKEENKETCLLLARADQLADLPVLRQLVRYVALPLGRRRKSNDFQLAR